MARAVRDRQEPQAATLAMDTALGPPRHGWASRQSIRREQRVHAAAFLAPTLLLVFLLVAYPLGYSLGLTLTAPSDVPGRLGPWVGFTHWARTTTDPVFAQSLVQHLAYLVPSIVLGGALGLAIALVLSQRFPGRPVVVASLFIPWALPPVVVAAMFQWFLDSRRGLFAHWLVESGIVEATPRLLSGIPGTLITLVGIHLWKTVPLVALIFLVALQYLPQETLHAARIDGARPFRRLLHVILPFLRPTIAAAVIVQAVVARQIYDLIASLTGGGPGAYSTYNLDFYAYRVAFQHTDLNYGSVLAYSVTILIVVVALVATRGKSSSLRLT